MQAWFARQTGVAGALDGLGDLVDPELLAQSAGWATTAVLACWIGFAVYVIVKRRLFARPPSTDRELHP